jgi:DNA-binding NarL/FixJ family response regulator
MINGKSGMAFDFSEQRMYLYLSGTHAYLPDTAKALTVHEQALAAQPSGVAVLDPVLIQLDQAISMARSGDATIACELAENALLTMPSGHRTSIVFTRAREVLTAIPSGRQPKAISSFRDALQLEGPR